MTTSAQPSPEAVELVAAALRAEREVVVREEYMSRQHLWGYAEEDAKLHTLVWKLDAASEKLWQYLIVLETKATAFDKLGLIQVAA